MNETTPLIETPSKPKKSPSPWLIFGGIWLCLSCAVVLCGSFALLIREGGNMPAFFATPVPTVDIVKVTTADPDWNLITDDGFDNNDNEWPVSSYENDSVRLERKIENGKYIWDFQAKNGWSFYGFPELKKYSDVVVSAEFKHTQGSLYDEYGFLLRAGGNEHYYFRINESGYYNFGYRSNDEDTSLLEGKTKLIRQGQFNQVTVKAEGTRFAIYLNNIQIADVEDDQFKSGWVGVLLSPSGLPGGENNANQQGTSFSIQETDYPSTFEVDNFKVWVSAARKPASEATPLAPLQPERGRIVYVTTRDGNREIYSIDTAGKDVNRLTNNPADDYSPRWSPDGRQIIFVSDRNGNPDIFLMNDDGSDITRLTDDPADDLDPSWSPDGNQIVFASNRDGNFNLYKLDIETGSVERLAEGGVTDRYPEWAPNGKFILFQSEREDDGINFFALELATGNIERLTFDNTSSINHPRWSPNGYSYINERKFDNGAVGFVIRDYPNKNLIPVISDGFRSNTWPAWSPSNTQIVFVSNRDGQIDIYIISKDGKSIFRLTDDESIESQVDRTD